MKRIVANSPAKINLTFDILGTMPDGYHEVLTLLQSVDLQDTITFHFEEDRPFQIELSCASSRDEIPLDQSNLVARAARVFVDRLNKEGASSATKFAIRAHIDKQIPAAAGLAGGSANAAATLVALNHYCDNYFPQSSLLEMATQLGADVPFCVTGGTKVGSRRGDVLTDSKLLNPLHMAIIKPREIAISTPWVYKAYDDHGDRQDWHRPDTNAAASALSQGDFDAAGRLLGNAFEPVVFAHHPGLGILRQYLLDLGSWACHLTGSGPTLYALVSGGEMAHFIRRQLLKDQSEGKTPWNQDQTLTLDCWIAQSTKTGATIVAFN